MPKIGRLTKGKRLYDYSSQGRLGSTVVSGRFKAAHDRISPGENQFTPVKILNKDGSDYGGEFYIFFVTTVLESIDPSLGGFRVERSREGVEYYTIKSTLDMPDARKRLAVHKDRIAGHAAWKDRGFGSPYTLCSDAFLAELAAIKATGYQKNIYFQEV